MWDKRFLELAEHVASWSKDPSTKCGAVIADGKRIVSIGFNGFPTRTRDDQSLYEDRPEKYRRVIHAEQNAMAFSNRDLFGCTLYVWPIPPCSQCAAMIIQRGIFRVVTKAPTDDQAERWGESFKTTVAMFREAGVALTFQE
jgi:dCMP deaminase